MYVSTELSHASCVMMTDKTSPKYHNLLILCAFISACGGAQVGGQQTADSPSVGHRGQVEGESLAQPAPDSSSMGSDENASQESTPEFIRLVLPHADSFLEASFPPSDPARYTGWKEAGRLQVGKSNLQFAEAIDGERLVLAMSTTEDTVHVYDRSTRVLKEVISVESLDRFGRSAMGPWPDGSTVHGFLAGRQDGLWLYDTASNQAPHRFDDAFLWRMRWSPDQSILLGASSDTKTQTSILYFYRRSAPDKLEKLAAFALPERVEAFDLSRDNRHLILSFYPSHMMVLADLHDGRILWRVPVPEFCSTVSFSPDGQAVAAGGASLVLLDASRPSRRTVFSGFGNNISNLRFSPSGDVIAVSSYDGKVRLLGWNLDTPSLSLIKTLSHTGTANVYSLRFLDGGNTLMSSSGDRTVRFWNGPAGRQTATSTAQQGKWKPLVVSEPMAEESSLPKPFDWQALDSQARTKLLAELRSEPRHHPTRLDGPASSSAIRPGKYACRVGSIYKHRDCIVEKTPEGHVMLEVLEGNLISMRGVLFDDGPNIRFEGASTGDHPFACFGCQDRCYLEDRGCACQPESPDRIRQCLTQPIHAVFRKAGTKWQGVVAYAQSPDELLHKAPLPADTPYADSRGRFTIELISR